MSNNFNLKIYTSIKKGISLALDDFDYNDTLDVKAKLKNISVDSGWETYKKYLLKKLHSEEYKESLINLYDVIFSVWRLNKQRNFSNKDIKEIFDSGVITGFSHTEIYALSEYIIDNNIINREYVDLDLPSGILWCTDNIGVENKEFKSSGFTYNTNNGSYFIWGNIEENPTESGGDKLILIKEPYKSKFLNGNKSRFRLTVLDDAAYNTNKHYLIPSYDQFEELFNNVNITKLPVENGIVCYSKKNPLNFIFFRLEQSLYLTSELLRNPDNKPKNNSIYLIFAKLFKNNVFSTLVEQKYLLWQNALLPAIMGHIRPIYIEK